jgi:large subunit ribosomal protein L17
MRHGKKVNHLGRTASHRKALLSNMANSLILKKRITTTVAKAKALRKYVEPLLTKAKTDSTHSRRTVFSYLQNKESVTELFGTVASRIAERKGGYTRIVKMGDVRHGDSAEMCLIELVDFNELYGKEAVAKKSRTRRGRGAKAKKEEQAQVGTETIEASAAENKAEEKATKKKADKKDKK